VHRCEWSKRNELYEQYHDTEWGVPVHDDRTLFEFLCLEGAQAGLSWITILKKREHYREVCVNFDARKIAKFDDAKMKQLLADPGIVRNRLKVEGIVKNARAFLTVQNEIGSFDSYIWSFVDGEPIQNTWESLDDVSARSPVSDMMSKDLKKHGFTFVGSTICYAFMQACGLVNDHVVDCFRWKEVQGSEPSD